jgi:hypothetical protein
LQFDQRAVDWFPRYFGDHDAMNHQDPRFAKIAGQNFVSISAGRTPEIGRPGGPSDWINPREAPSPPKVSLPVVQAPVAQADPAPTAAPASVEPPAPEPAPIPGLRRSVPRSLLLANAPSQSGMISAPPSATPQTPKDPWAGPVSVPKSDVTVVSPGARVKLGGSGV